MQKEKGITLIALIITIIVMLILVAVTVTAALNGGLFTKVGDTSKQTQLEADREILLSAVIGAIKNDGTVDFDILDKNIPEGFTGSEGTYTSANGNQFTVKEDGEIINKGENGEIITLPEGWTEAEKPSGWSDNVIVITDGTNVVPLPNGFEISKEETEDSIEEGLVIKDGANEFVWVPVTDAENYIESDFGPLTETDNISNCILDSQEELDYYYGKDYYNYAEDFTYEEDKTKAEESIKTYGGFYVGRYETTIDENGIIGSMRNKEVLTSKHVVKEGTNPNITTNFSLYYYRWWGLYKVQKDIYKNNHSVGSLMISTAQRELVTSFAGCGWSDVKTRPTDSYSCKPDLSGSAYSTDSSNYDVGKNIYDLAGNVCEWTAEAAGGGRPWWRRLV